MNSSNDTSKAQMIDLPHEEIFSLIGKKRTSKVFEVKGVKPWFVTEFWYSGVYQGMVSRHNFNDSKFEAQKWQNLKG